MESLHLHLYSFQEMALVSAGPSELRAAPHPISPQASEHVCLVFPGDSHGSRGVRVREIWC